MKIDINQFRETFFEEAAGRVRQMEAGLLALAEGDADPDLPNFIRRAAHTIEGTAGAFGLMETVELAHAVNRCLADAVEIRIDLLLDAVDVLEAMLDAARRGAAPLAHYDAMRRRLNAVPQPVPHNPPSPLELRRDDAEVFLQGVNPAMVLQALDLLAAT
jgi:two-component system chemotaxis sensor kinase CheA